MKGKVFCEPANREEWLAARRLGITGTDIAALCGESRYRNKLSVYIDKVGEGRDIQPTEAMELGNIFEEPIANLWAERNGASIKKFPAIIQSADHPLVLGSIDRLVLSPEEAVLEVKLVGGHNAGAWADGGIPNEYYLQVMWYLMATGLQKGHIAALVGSTSFVERTIEYDPQLAANLVDIASTFWTQHVEHRMPPAIDGSDSASEWIARMWPESDGSLIVMPPEATHWVNRYREAKANEEAALAVKEEAVNNLKVMMAEHEKATCSDGTTITWKTTQQSRLNQDRLKTDHPHLFDQYRETSNIRRFLVKPPKGA